jgi:hypothetical protein
LLLAALLEAGVPPTEFGIIPFPLEDMTILSEFLPQTVPILTTICEDWNRIKIEKLRTAGYTVDVLWERTRKAITGQQVRDLIDARDDTYARLVPSATVRVVEDLRLWDRLTGERP